MADSNSLAEYLEETYESVRRGPWYLRPSGMLLEAEEFSATEVDRRADVDEPPTVQSQG
jgi:hypothetical protein